MYIKCLKKQNLLLLDKRISSGPNVICETINVLGATYANCDGRYKFTDEQVDWAPERPVYKHITKDRYIFWNAGGLGWSIGKRSYLSTGSHWHRSKLNYITMSNTILKSLFYTKLNKYNKIIV